MKPSASPSFRRQRALGASLALLAMAVATSAPILHAWSHEAADVHHDLGLALVGEEGSHDEVHPLALHDDWLVVRGVDFVLSPALPSTQQEEVVSEVVARSPVCAHDVPILCGGHSPPNPARAPPLV